MLARARIEHSKTAEADSSSGDYKVSEDQLRVTIDQPLKKTETQEEEITTPFSYRVVHKADEEGVLTVDDLEPGTTVLVVSVSSKKQNNSIQAQAPAHFAGRHRRRTLVVSCDYVEGEEDLPSKRDKEAQSQISTEVDTTLYSVEGEDDEDEDEEGKEGGDKNEEPTPTNKKTVKKVARKLTKKKKPAKRSAPFKSAED